jgi:hypothetical protein
VVSTDGWGFEVRTQYSDTTAVRARAWRKYSGHPVVDRSDVRVTVLPVAETPVIDDASFFVLQSATEGTVVGRVTARDEDVVGSLSYRIVAGDPSSGAWRSWAVLIDAVCQCDVCVRGARFFCILFVCFGAAFTIHATSGTISVAADATTTLENTPTFWLVVEVSDGALVRRKSCPPRFSQASHAAAVADAPRMTVVDAADRRRHRHR